eukprot:3098351-Alexandrium_andersonii.AAC.1
MGQAAHYTAHKGDRCVNTIGIYLRPSARVKARDKVSEWAVARAIGLGRSSEVVVAGDWNEEPETASAAHWAAVLGWGALVPGCPT